MCSISLGFPHNVKTEEQKENYVKLINESYGCNLQTTDIVYNEGMRNVAKLLSNRSAKVYILQYKHTV